MNLLLRPLLTAALALLALEAVTIDPSVARAQEPAQTKRRIVSHVAPVYPQLANRMRITGTVKVEALVAPNGKVKTTQVIGGSPLLVKAAVDAIQQWKWGPAPEDTKELVQLNFNP